MIHLLYLLCCVASFLSESLLVLKSIILGLWASLFWLIGVRKWNLYHESVLVS